MNITLEIKYNYKIKPYLLANNYERFITKRSWLYPIISCSIIRLDRLSLYVIKNYFVIYKENT